MSMAIDQITEKEMKEEKRRAELYQPDSLAEQGRFFLGRVVSHAFKYASLIAGVVAANHGSLKSAFSWGIVYLVAEGMGKSHEAYTVDNSLYDHEQRVKKMLSGAAPAGSKFSPFPVAKNSLDISSK